MQSVGLTFRLEKLRYASDLIKFLKSSFSVLLFLFIFSILKSVPKHIENIRQIQDKLSYYIVDKVELYNYHIIAVHMSILSVNTTPQANLLF